MNKQEKELLISFVNNAKEDLNFSFRTYHKTYPGYVQGNKLINYINQLDEPQKVKVPQFVAEWIETAKKEKRTLHYSMQDIDDACYYHKGDDSLYRWMFVCDDSSEHQEMFARAWLDGYEIEEEPKWKIINDQKYCLTSIEAGYGNSLHWAFDSTKKKPILFDNEETALYTAYITGGTVEKV